MAVSSQGFAAFGSQNRAIDIITQSINDYLAEIILHAVARTRSRYAGLSLMVWILKREVRAFGGCLGMYRRRRTWHAAISVGEM